MTWIGKRKGGSRTRPNVGATRQVVDGQPQGLALRREAWVPASARTTGGERWFASLPLRRRGEAVRGNSGGRDGSPHARGQAEGEGGSRTRPYVGITERDVGGQPQGLPLWRRGAGYSRENGWGRAFTRGVPTEVGSDGERGEGRFQTCPLGVAEHDVDGQPQGLPLRREGGVPAFGDLCITIIPAPSQNPEVGI